MERRVLLVLPVLLAACGGAPSTTTPTAWPSITWSVTGVGLNVDHHVSGGMYTAHLSGCVRTADLAPVDQATHAVVGMPLTVYNDRSVAIPEGGTYSAASIDAADCAWTLTLTPS